MTWRGALKKLHLTKRCANRAERVKRLRAQGVAPRVAEQDIAVVRDLRPICEESPDASRPHVALGELVLRRRVLAVP